MVSGHIKWSRYELSQGPLYCVQIAFGQDTLPGVNSKLPLKVGLKYSPQVRSQVTGCCFQGPHLNYTCQLFLTQKREIFIRILWNPCAHIRKSPKTFWKFTKIFRTFPKILQSSSELGSRISFAKHILFSFKNQRIFRERTVIYMDFSIHNCFKYKLRIYI